jgi:hypothetical protein
MAGFSRGSPAVEPREEFEARPDSNRTEFEIGTRFNLVVAQVVLIWNSHDSWLFVDWFVKKHALCRAVRIE